MTIKQDVSLELFVNFKRTQASVCLETAEKLKWSRYVSKEIKKIANIPLLVALRLFWLTFSMQHQHRYSTYTVFTICFP